ncbi:MAG: methyltransferase [Microbacteriaceae bacterium]
MTAMLTARLRADLTAAQFTVPTLTALWGSAADEALFRGFRVPALRALRSHQSPAATLARLFVLGLPVSPEAVAVALPSLGVAGAAELGLIETGTTDIRPLLDLRPYSFTDRHGDASWWIASDLGELALGRELREDHVLGVGGASMTLSALMIQTPVDSVLDLGTGCGIQAMHASRHARRVVATDISERALELAALNATLNGIDSIEFRLGSLYEPVQGERFDQIVSNPPFVITPRAEGVPAYEYRDGGMVGDGIVEAVIRGAADHLTPQGVAQLLGNWEYRGSVHAFDRVGEWLEDAGLDAWIIEREVQDAALYSETWIRDGGIRPGDAFDSLYDAWLNDFAARDVAQVGFGYVTLRRRPDPRRRLERQLGPLGNNPAGLGAHLEACLAAADSVAALSDAELAATALTVAADVTEERHYWPGDDDPTVMLLRQGGGFARTVTLDTALAAVVGASDGGLSVAAICAAIGQLLDVDAEHLTMEVLPRLRELVETGILQLSEGTVNS